MADIKKPATPLFGSPVVHTPAAHLSSVPAQVVPPDVAALASSVIGLQFEIRATNTRLDTLEGVNRDQNQKLDGQGTKLASVDGKVDTLLRMFSPSAVHEIVKTEIHASDKENERADQRAKVAHRRDMSKTALAGIIGGISSVAVALVGAGFLLAGKC